MVSFTDNPLNSRTAATEDLVRASSATTMTNDGSRARDSASKHTAMLSAAHSMQRAVNPLLLQRASARAPASARTAFEETDGGNDNTARVSCSLHATHKGGDGSGETLSLQLKQFTTPVTKDFTNKLHFFQALEQGAIDRHLTSVEDADMEMIEQMGSGGAIVELEGELVLEDSLSDSRS